LPVPTKAAEHGDSGPARRPSAEIEIDYVPTGRELQSGTFSGPNPGSHSLWLAIFISNAGARERGEPYWVGISAQSSRTITSRK